MLPKEFDEIWNLSKPVDDSSGWLLAGIVVVDALAIANVSAPLALGFVVLTPLLRLWQRWVAAT